MCKFIFLCFLIFHFDNGSSYPIYYMRYIRVVPTGANGNTTEANVKLTPTSEPESQANATLSLFQTTEPHFSTFVNGQNCTQNVSTLLDVGDSIVISFWDNIPDYARFENSGSDSDLDFFFYGCRQPVLEPCLLYQGAEDSFCISFNWAHDCPDCAPLHYGYDCDDVLPTVQTETSSYGPSTLMMASTTESSTTTSEGLPPSTLGEPSTTTTETSSVITSEVISASITPASTDVDSTTTTSFSTTVTSTTFAEATTKLTTGTAETSAGSIFSTLQESTTKILGAISTTLPEVVNTAEQHTSTDAGDTITSLQTTPASSTPSAGTALPITVTSGSSTISFEAKLFSTSEVPSIWISTDVPLSTTSLSSSTATTEVLTAITSEARSTTAATSPVLDSTTINSITTATTSVPPTIAMLTTVTSESSTTSFDPKLFSTSAIPSIRISTLMASSEALPSTTSKASSTTTAQWSTKSVATLSMQSEVQPSSTDTSESISTTTAATTDPDSSTATSTSSEDVTIENAGTILDETLYFTDDPGALTSENVSDVATILEKSARVVGLPLNQSNSVVLNIDNIMSASDAVIVASNSSNRFLNVITTLMLNMADKNLKFLGGINLGLSSSNVICGESANNNGLVDLGGNFGMITDNSPKFNREDNSIRVQVDDICEERQVSQVYFTIYRNRKLHQSSINYATYKNKKLDNDPLVGDGDNTNGGYEAPVPSSDEYPSPCVQQLALMESSPVMAATILSYNTEISRLTQSEAPIAYLTFNTTDVLRPLHGEFTVTWWDETNSIWSTEDRCTSKYDGDIVTAECPHLTNMALLVDGQLSDPSVCNKALESVGYMANSLSVASLAFLLFINLCAFSTVLANQRWLRAIRGNTRMQPDIVQTAYTADLLLFYIVFTVFSNENVSGGACEFFGALSYVLLMTSIFLTIFTALRTVTLFLEHRLRILAYIMTRPPVVMGISFLLPFVLTLVLFFTTPLFERNDSFCWVRPDLVVYSTIIPTSMLLLNGLVCTIIVCWRIFGTERKFRRSGQFTDDKEVKKKIIAVFIMQFTLGMPWVLQYFTLYSPHTTAWHYIFTIVIGSQGTILALLFLYKRRCTIRSRSHASRIRSGENGVATENTETTSASDA